MKNVVYAFIDASNLWQAQKVRGELFDLEKLKNYLKQKHKASELKVYYYTAYPKEGTREYSTEGKHKFFTYLKKGLGFVVRKKELKRIKINSDQGEIIEEKGNMDVEMTIDAVNLVNKYSTAILFTGDSDFLALVIYIKNHNKKVYIYSSQNNISSELRTGGDGYVDVLKIYKNIWRNQIKHRDQK
jgi:uncharacterized LabA/DUF88 family protein